MINLDEKFLPIRGYFNEERQVILWPSKKHKAKQLLVLEFLADKFEKGKKYSEIEVNKLLNQYHIFGDPALLRREMVGYKLLKRTLDCRDYQV